MSEGMHPANLKGVMFLHTPEPCSPPPPPLSPLSTALLMCPANLEGPSRGEWLGGGRVGRVAVLHRLQALLPPSLMLPQARLEVLVEQALLAQASGGVAGA